MAHAVRRTPPPPDTYFDPAGQTLLKAFLLAASLASAPVTQVYTWLTRPHDETTREAAGRRLRHRPANGFLPDRPR